MPDTLPSHAPRAAAHALVMAVVTERAAWQRCNRALTRPAARRAGPRRKACPCLFRHHGRADHLLRAPLAQDPAGYRALGLAPCRGRDGRTARARAWRHQRHGRAAEPGRAEIRRAGQCRAAPRGRRPARRLDQCPDTAPARLAARQLAKRLRERGNGRDRGRACEIPAHGPEPARPCPAGLDGAALPTGTLRLPAGQQVSALPGYAEGAFWVQDAASALPARWLAGHTRVLDLCAAPGGKTMQLAAMGADVTALDVSDARLDRLRENLSRTGLAAHGSLRRCADMAARCAVRRGAAGCAVFRHGHHPPPSGIAAVRTKSAGLRDCATCRRGCWTGC